MKITKTGEDEKRLKRLRERANFGCQKCPCCGEDKDSLYYIHRGISNKGISRGLIKSWAEGFIVTKFYQIDCYRCKTCGAEWESEKYEYC